jgi:hypothetical protein
VQADTDVLPVDNPEVEKPKGQDEHVAAPAEDEKLPAGQGIHDDEPADVEYWPAGQMEHVDAPARE